MSGGEQFSLVWNSFPTNLSSGLYSLLTDEHLVDVTLTAEGKILRAHKLILSVCSSYFKELFEGNMCKHPIVILKDVNYRDLSAMLHFMYQGEVSIKQEDIASFLKLGETLQIKGLTKDKKIGETSSNERGINSSVEICKDTSSKNSQEIFSRKLEDPIISSPGNVSCPNNSLIRVTSGGVCPQMEMDTSTEKVIRSTSVAFNEKYIKSEEPESVDADEPLDYTSDVIENNIKNEEPLNCRLNEDTNNRTFEDIVPNFQQQQQQQDCKRQTIGMDNEAKNTEDFHYEGTTSFGRGKRSLRGITGGEGVTSSHEGTLRGLSDIGPSLGIDRGKVVRMHSCPWCLRHFTRKENLKLHVRYIHGPLESLTCKLCGNKYKNSNSLRVHSYLYHNTRRSKHPKSQRLT